MPGFSTSSFIAPGIERPRCQDPNHALALHPNSWLDVLCARSPVLGTEVNVETEDPLCATALAERDAGTGREPDAAGAAAEANKARGRRQLAVVQHRRVLHEKHDGSAAAAPGHRVLVGINDVLYADPRVGQEPVRRPLLPLAGENHGQRSPRTRAPGLAHP